MRSGDGEVPNVTQWWRDADAAAREREFHAFVRDLERVPDRLAEMG